MKDRVHHSLVELGQDVQQAFQSGMPVLALESTIISHGMPFPRNLETALAVQNVVRDNGAVPATIAIMDGKLKVGLNDSEIESLARAGTAVSKCSRRDIPFLLASGAMGATTVAATMIVAEMVGIRAFATGGIGGVHRGAGQTMDVSADLQELARSNVAVICAGPKAILDIGLTLEYLETHGIPVIGYQTEELPAFYSRTSGFNVDYRLDTPEEIADAMQTKWSLGQTGGCVIANPIPAEHELEAPAVEKLIDQAVAEADQKGISGKELTPFLLERLEELSGGECLNANTQLILNNAAVGAEIAVAMAAEFST